MQLKSIFLRPVDRNIEGVIKADDEASLRSELEEYVLTNEAAKRLESFLDAYNDYRGANGVWVSGFFGSGKSHLLKILALVLENRAIEDRTALDLFLPKVQNNEILFADLRRAASIPSKSILFNIDQKADVISKTQVDALLAVFVKVFDEACGYYGKQPHIAHFERGLDQDGLFDDFRRVFRELSGQDWEWGRARTTRVASFIDEAFNRVTGQHQAGVLDKHRADYRLSIEDFAQQVNAWLATQPPGFRLNFFVDEVGQYVADNTKLMTNLQTVAESLATKCNGRAWVIVTAQEDMNAVIGEMSKQNSNDFTKIQARFANRMKLTSADVAEVIQKRLLLKNEDGVRLLHDIYRQQSNNFKTLFDFADGAQVYRNFQDADHFIRAYPFIPYQFSLFQSAIQGLSLHNGFEGKHSSVGERSMLGVFREVAIAIAERPVGQLATFELMFEGIRTALKTAIQSAIRLAERNLEPEHPFAVRLLKVLFLVKYVKEFKATVRNLSVLMLEGFDQDLPTLRKRIEAELNLLEQHTYIQRNGEIYEYLTDEEKDIEQEIKNTEVEAADVAAELEKLVFDGVLRQRKVRYLNGQDYPYSRRLDDRLQGREYELAIHVITPFNENAAADTVQRMQSMGRDELRVVMPQDVRLIQDLTLYKQTEKYIRQNVSTAQQEVVKRILENKGFQNRQRLATLETRVQQLLAKAKLIINAGDVDLGGEDAQGRLVKGFHKLIEYSYPNLRMLRDVAFTESDIGKHLRHSREGLLGSDVTRLSEAEQELLSFIQGNVRGALRTTVRSVLERFERKPYGWYYAAILCNLALLCARGKLEVRHDGQVLEDAALESALKNTHLHATLVLEPQVEFTAAQVRALKDFHADFFDRPAAAAEAKVLARETLDAFRALHDELSVLHAQAAQFPFLNALGPVLATLKELASRPVTWCFTELARQEDALLELKERVIEPLRRFMGGPQKAIYEEAAAFVREQEDNFAYVPGEEAAQIRAVLVDPEGYKGNRLSQLRGQLASLQARIAAEREREATAARAAVTALELRLRGEADFAALTPTQQAELTQPFEALQQALGSQKRIAMVRDLHRRFEDETYPRLLTQLGAWARPVAASQPTQPSTVGAISEPDLPAKPIASVQAPIVPARAIPVAYDKALLATEDELDRYLSALRQALLAEILAGKRVQI